MIADELKSLVVKEGEKVRNLSNTLHDSVENAYTVIQDSKAVVNDRYGNSLNSSGTFDVAQHYSTYGFSNDTLNWPLWMALYNDSWVFRRAIDKPATDEINSGIVLYGGSNVV